MALAQKQELKKHVAAVHISNKLSLLQRKAANVLLLNAYEELLTKEKHRIRIKELAMLIGFESHNQEVLKEALRGLMSTVLEWGLLDEQGEENGWEGCPMLASARIQHGWCMYSYSQELREKLYNPEIYARINLSIQRQFSSGYALALYENCARYRNVGSTGWIEMDVYRELMGVPNGKHADFKRFSSRVIRDPVKQVNKTSDILIEPTYKREKRKVTAIKFLVKENSQLSLFADKALPGRLLVKCSRGIEQRLREYGLTNSQARKILDICDDEYIIQNLDVVEKDYQAGKVESLSAYTLAALKEDYRPKQAAYEAKPAERKALEAQAKEEQQRLETQKRELEAQRLQQALDALSEQELQELQKRFLEHHKSNRLLRRWLKQGFEHKVVQGLFRAFAAELLFQEPVRETWGLD
jgi:hypothetical protein